jgi:hypothetical protein
VLNGTGTDSAFITSLVIAARSSATYLPERLESHASSKVQYLDGDMAEVKANGAFKR